MACKLCGSFNQATFATEMNFHLPGRAGLDTGPILASSKILVCLNCGHAEFVLSEGELQSLKSDAASHDRTSSSGEK